MLFCLNGYFGFIKPLGLVMMCMVRPYVLEHMPEPVTRYTRTIHQKEVRNTMTATEEHQEETLEEEDDNEEERPAMPPVPRSRRAPEQVPFALTGRDVALLLDVWRFRLLTTSQLETLRRADPDTSLRFVSRLTLTRRLKGLFHHRFVRRIARPAALGSLEPVYVLDREGARALSLQLEEQGEAADVRAPLPSRLPKAAGLEHLLLINQARVAFSCASSLGEDENQTLQMLEWRSSDEARFRVEVAAPGTRRGAATQTVTLLPDAGMVLRVRRGERRSRHVAFLEADRGTEPLATLAAKARAYHAFWKSGGFERAYNAPPSAGFWVLFTVPSKARGATLLRALREVEGGLTMFRVALESDLRAERIANAVWTEASQGAPVRPCQPA